MADLHRAFIASLAYTHWLEMSRGKLSGRTVAGGEAYRQPSRSGPISSREGSGQLLRIRADLQMTFAYFLEPAREVLGLWYYSCFQILSLQGPRGKGVGQFLKKTRRNPVNLLRESW